LNALWAYFWPAIGLGILIGVITGLAAFRIVRRRATHSEPVRMRRHLVVPFAIGAVASVATAALWHGPFGAADRFASRVERGIHNTLVYYEMTQVTAHLHHGPLTRRVLLSGQADDFQRTELVRLMDEVPGVSSTSWSPDGGSGLPLVAQGAVVSLVGFLFGLLLAYLVELHRRYNAQWNW